MFLTYETLETVCRLFIFLEIGASIRSNLPDDPWTRLDDVEHMVPVGAAESPPSLQRIGNLTFLPPTVNKSIKDMPWPQKREIYKLLSSVERFTTPSPILPGGGPLPASGPGFSCASECTHASSLTVSITI